MREASDDALLTFLPETLRHLLATLQPDLLQGPSLRELVGTLWTPADLLADDASRIRLTMLLSADRAADLAEHLNLQGANELMRHLAAGKVPAGTARSWKYFSLPNAAVSRSSDLVPRTSVTPQYGLFDYQRTAMKDVLAALGTPPRR